MDLNTELTYLKEGPLPLPGVAGLAHLSPDLIRSIDIQTAQTSRPADKVDILRSACGKDGKVGLETASRRLRLALLLLLPPDFRAHSKRLRDRTRTPSRLSHSRTILMEKFEEWKEQEPGSLGYR